MADELAKRIEAIEQTLDLYRLHGLDVLRTRNISYHPVTTASEAPTRKGAKGELVLVSIGGTNYLYANVDGGTTWERVTLS